MKLALLREFLTPLLSFVCFIACLIAIVVLELFGTAKAGLPGEITTALQVSLGGVLASGPLVAQTRRRS
jgi:hypothetical protein